SRPSSPSPDLPQGAHHVPQPRHHHPRAGPPRRRARPTPRRRPQAAPYPGQAGPVVAVRAPPVRGPRHPDAMTFQLVGGSAILLGLYGTWLAAQRRAGWLICVASSALWFPALVTGGQWAAVLNC